MTRTDKNLIHKVEKNSPLDYIRPTVRNEHPYVVGGFENVSVKLNQNESPFDLPEDLKRELVENFLRIPFNRYPGEQPERLRTALAEYAGCDPDGILVGNGSNELTYLLGLALIAPGTPVVLPRPMFSLYEKVVRLYDGDLTSIPPRSDLSFDVDALCNAVQKVRPALTVITSPNNPTGLSLTIEEIERVVEAASGFVLVDEAYFEFNNEESARALLSRYQHLIILRTLSKAFGLAGLRLGYLIAHPDVIREFGKARIPFMIDPISETTALALLKRPDLIRERVSLLKSEKNRLAEALSAFDDVEVIPSQANFVIFRTPLKPGTLLARLANAGVLLRNMEGYQELKGFLRVNAGTPTENKLFLDALKMSLRAPDVV